MIIIDDGNLDPVALLALIEKHHIACQYLKKETPGLTASRNFGVRHARGDIILFLDDDVLLDPGYIAAIMEIYADDKAQEIGGVTGALQVTTSKSTLLFLSIFGLDGARPGVILPSGIGVLVREGWFDRPIPVQWLSGSNMSYRRQVFDQFQFDQRLGAYGWGEDKDFSFRVAQVYRLMAIPNAKLIHLKEPSGRINVRYLGFMETNYLYRFFAKSSPKRAWNWLALSWAMVGIMLKNVMVGLTPARRRSAIEQLRGNLQGIRAIRTGKDYTP
jgi:GT2 family glycosyltransferase